MGAAIYARYSSENQRPESIEDQVRACRTHAAKTHLVVLEDHIYTDQAMSGANPDRPGLTALRAAAQRHSFDVALVDDLSRLARDNALMLLVLNDLQYAGVRVISVADHLDTSDENALLGIQVRGVFNELALSDLKKKTHRGQLGQKQRGYFVGEAALGYRSEAAGTISYDKHGRARPEGFLMHVDPAEAEVVRRIFREAAEGRPFTRIMKGLNEDGVPGRIRSAHGWTVGSVRRILENTKYRGHWVWNKRGTCRDRRTGHRRWFLKPESEWVVCDDEALRIVPQELWDRVAERLREIKRVWPGGEARRGFGPGQVSRVHAYPPYLLSGAMVCGDCGRAIALVSGHRGGYYGCSAAARRACGNRVRVPRRVAEKVVLAALRDRVLRPEPVMRVLDRVREEITKLCADVPGLLRAKRAQLAQARGRVARIVNFVALGRAQDSKALAEALVKDEALVASLEVEVEGLQSASDSRVRFPSRPWVEKRLAAFRELLERRTEASALVLRRLLGRMVLKPVYPEQGKPYYVARTAIDVLVLLEPPGSDPSSDPGANSFGWWRRRALHPRPESRFVRSSTLVAVLAGLAVESRRRRVPDRQRVSPRRGMLRHISARPALWMPPLFRPADAGGARRAAAVIGRTSSSAVRTSRWTCSSKTGPRRRSASIAPHGLESVRDDGDAGGAAVGRLAFDLRRNGSDGGGLPRALLNFGSGSSHCPLRGCPCYATSATMLSGGASASKTPTRESSLQIAARDGEADARR